MIGDRLPKELAGPGVHVMGSRRNDVRLNEPVELILNEITDFVKEALGDLAKAGHIGKQGMDSVIETTHL